MELPVLVGKEMRKPTWGIRVVPDTGESTVRKLVEETQQSGRQTGLSFVLRVGPFQSGDNKLQDQFVTNPTVQSIIQREKIPDRYPVGRFTIVITPELKTIAVSDIQAIDNHFFRTGIASFAEYRIEKIFEKLLPGYHTVSGPSNSDFRKAQLRKRGRIPSAEAYYEIGLAAKLSRDYLAKEMKKHRPRLPWRNQVRKAVNSARLKLQRLKPRRNRK